jgi:replication-associated recombination protein RarA
MRFDDLKTDTLNLRVAPSFKKMLKAVADGENRSMVNMLEVILVDYCQRYGTPNSDVAAAISTKRKRVADARGKAHDQV